MKNYFQQILKLWTSLPRNRQMVVGGVVLTVLIGLVWFVASRSNHNLQPLYTDLKEEDAAKVVEKLKTLEVVHRIDAGKQGVNILIPSEKLADTRLSMASSGLPSSGRLGFEIFDQSDFAATEFTEQIKYARALEGELERSIQLIESIEKARVHITFPKDSVFLESRRPAKASVMVKLRENRDLSRRNITAITMLVARAVEVLEPDSVTLLDMEGNLLDLEKPAEDRQRDEAALAYRKKLEQSLLAKVRDTLDPLLGADRYSAGVSVECDFSLTEQSEELFNPEQSVISTSLKTEETTSRRQPGGVPGTATNLPRPTVVPTAGANDIARRTENVTYQSSRSVRKTQIPQGRIQRISVGIVFDQRVQFTPNGDISTPSLVPTPEERVNSIRDLVAAVAGINPERGDVVTVQSLAFEETLNRIPVVPATGVAPTGKEEIPPIDWQKALPGWFADFIQKLRDDPQMLLIVASVATVLLLLIAVSVYFLLRSRKKKISVQMEQAAALKEAQAKAELEGRTAEDGSALPGQDPRRRQLEEHQALKDELTAEELQKLKLAPVTTKQSEILIKHLREVVQKDGDFAAHVLLTWLADD